MNLYTEYTAHALYKERSAAWQREAANDRLARLAWKIAKENKSGRRAGDGRARVSRTEPGRCQPGVRRLDIAV
jgi:hypothetical protein